MRKHLLLLILSLSIFALTVNAQALNGTYTIDQVAATADYVSFTAAVADLTANGVSGPVAFNVANQTFTEQVNIPVITGSSASNTVTFNGNGCTLTNGVTSSMSRHTLRLAGADYFVFNNLTITTTGTSNATALHLYNASNHNIFNTCNFNASILLSLSSIGCVQLSTSATTLTATGSFLSNDYNVFDNCIINGGYYAYGDVGSTTDPGLGNQILNCTIRGYRARGIYIGNSVDAIVSNNEVTRPIRSNTTFNYGIYALYPINALIEKNSIHHTHAQLASSTSTTYALRVFTNSTTAADGNTIVNNSISNINNRSAQYGMYITGTGHNHIYHNTIDLSSTTAPSLASYTTTGIYNGSSSSGNDIRNNNINVTRTSPAPKLGFHFTSLSTGFISNYNNIYVNGSGTGTNYIAQRGTTLSVFYSTIADWNTGPFAGSSTALNPIFVNSVAGDHNIGNASLLNSGTNIGVADDIQGASRANPPNVGCYEGGCAVPMTGNYTINPAGAGANNFPTVIAAVDRLVNCGVSGPVVIDFQGAAMTYTEQINIPEIYGASFVNTITFNGNGRTLAYANATSSSRYTLRLAGADHFTFNDLTISATGTSVPALQYGMALIMYNASNYNHFNNCNFNTSTSTTHINNRCVSISTGASFYSTNSAAPSNHYNIFDNCNFSGGYWGFAIGGSIAERAVGNQVINSTITDYRATGMSFSYNRNLTVRNNDISRPTRLNTVANYGMNFFSLDYSLVEKNYIHHTHTLVGGSTSSFDGIRVSTNNSSPAAINTIRNNVVGNINSSGPQTGLHISGNGHNDIYHNTIDLSGTNAGSSIIHETIGIYNFSSISGNDFRNNNIYITRPASGNRYGINHNTTLSGFMCDYNNIYVNSSGAGSNYIGSWNSTNYPTIANWQAGTTFGNNSTSADPQFINPSSGDYTIGNPSIFTTGVALGVIDDFLNAIRSQATPTVGAFESACSPMAGNYDINPANSASASNFQTIDSAVQRLINCGVNAPVIFNIAAGNTFPEQITIPEIVGASATNTITFNGNGSILTHAATSIPSAYTLRLDGADYFRFDSLSFECTGASYGFGAHLVDDANNNIFDRCEFNLPINSSGSWQVGLVINCAYSGGIFTGTANAPDSNQIINCEMNNGQRGLVLFAHSGDIGLDNLIENNRLTNNNSTPMSSYRQSGLIVRGNEVQRPNISPTAGFLGYYFLENSNTLIDKNIVHTPVGGNINTTLEVRGFTIAGSPPVGQENIVSNNIVANFRSKGQQYGFYYNGINTKFLHNTVVLDDSSSATQFTYGIRDFGAGTGSEYNNNIIVVSRNNCGNGSGAAKYGLYLSNPPAVCDYNNVYVSGVSALYYSRIGASNHSTLYDFQNYGANVYAQNSSEVNPGFVGLFHMDFTPTNSLLNNAGNNVGVIDDYNGNARTVATPDIGAIEFGCTTLAGTYTINPALPASGSNFTSISAAVYALQCGITAPVIFNMAPSTAFNEHVDIYEIPGASATNTITFNGNNCTLNYVSCSDTRTFVIRLSGADYLRFNDLTISNNGTNSYGTAVHMYDGANSNIFDNCTFSLPIFSNNGLYGLVMSSDPVNPSSANTGFAGCNNNEITNSTFTGGEQGILLRSNATNRHTNNEITNNTIEDFYSTGIQIFNSESSLVENNNISRPNRTVLSSATNVGINVLDDIRSTISKNHIHNLFAQNTSSTAVVYGIDYYADLSNNLDRNTIVNNLIEDLNHTGSQYAIHIDGITPYVTMIHNTVDLSGTTANNNGSIFPQTIGLLLSGSGGANCDFRNNNISITRAGTARKVGVFINSTAATGVQCDFNNVYLNAAGTSNLYGRVINTPYATLANWQAGTVYGNNSTEVAPQFLNVATNDYTPTNGAINNTGINLGVTDDINGLARSAITPDVGAFEWACNPISGTYTIDPLSPIAPSNVQTFQQAVDLLSCGISGPVIFNVVGAPTFNEQIDIPVITGSSAANTVTFNGNGSTLTHAATSSTSRHTLRLSGTDYFRFNNLNISATSAVNGHAVHLYDEADNNIFDSCTIQTSATTTATNVSGFVISTDPNTITITGAFSGCDNNQLINSTVSGGRRGVVIYGKSSDRPANNIFQNNIIADFYEYGIRLTNSNGTVIGENDINKLNRNTGTTFYGIRSGSDRNTVIDKNHIHHPFGSTTTSTNLCYGIFFAGSVASGNDNYVTNNLIEDFINGGSQYGLYAQTTAHRVKFYHNTIDLSNPVSTGGTTVGIYAANTFGIEVQNNLVSITRNASGQKYGVYILTGSNTICNYNNVYINTSTLGYFGRYGTSSLATLLTWQQINAGAYGQNSYDLDPQYFSPSTDDYNPSNLAMDNISAPLGVLDDIENVTRSTTNPDAGAYEFACSGGSTIVTNFVAPTDTTISCFGAMDGQVTVQSSLGTGPYTYYLLPGSSSNTTGNFTGLDTGLYSIIVYDATSCTDTISFYVSQPDSLIVDSVVVVQPGCSPANNGSITVYISGGTTTYNYDIGAATQTSNAFNGLVANSYTVTVTDANNCTATTMVILTTPGAPTIVSSADTNVSCNGANDGSILFTATGTGAISYNLQPTNITNGTGYFNNLAPNNYTVTATDASGCTVSTTANITQPTQLNIDSLTASNPTCTPGGDGSIVVNISGGTAGFQYNIGGANQASNTFSSLGSATYLVTVTDTNSCSDTMSVTITAPGAPTIVSSTDNNVSCNGANDGSILFTATGTGAISYNLQPTNITNATGYFNNLSPNNYTITATDASGCTVSTTANITQPTQLNIDSLTASNPTCTPGGDGSIVVNISGGTAGYQYNIGGANQASNTFSSLGSATYLVTVTDTNSCTDTMSVTLVTPSVPTVASAVDTNVSCNGAGDGSIAVTATGASAISYTLNPGAVTNATGYFNNLAPNTYTVTVSDTSNCTVDTSFVITQPAVLNIDSLTATNPTCTPGGDGSIVVNISGGTAGFQYNIGGANQASNTFSSLGSATYLVTVADTNSCSDTMSVTITAPGAPTIVSSADTNVSCNGANDGSILFTATGTGAISYNLQPTNITNGTGYFNNLAPNNYTVTATDASGCTVSTTANITQPTQLNIDSLTASNPTCTPGGDGSIVVNISGGTAGFQYNIGGANQASNTFSSLGSATYLVTVTDTNSCSDTMSVTITAPGAPTIVSSADTNVSCNGANDGSILFTATGTGAISYNLQPTNITNGTGYFNNLAPNNYTVTATDASGCTVSTTANITQPTQLNIDSLTASNPTCTPGGDGSIVVNISGGTAGFQYNIGGANQASNTFSSLGSATYLVTVTDTNSCSDTMSVTITAPGAPTIVSSADTNVSCNGANDGSILFTATGTGAISYNLQPTNITNGTGYFNNLAPNNYTVTATDASGCTVSTTANITQPTQLNIDSLTASNPTCTPGGDGSIVVNISGGTAGFQYNIGGANQASNTFSSLGSATYLVTVTDTNSCSDTMSVTITAPGAPTIVSSADTNVSCNGANDGSILFTATGTGAISYNLQPTNITNGTGYFNNLAPNNYTVTATDASGCTVSTTANITQPTQLNIDSLTASNPTCTPGGDGSIVVNISGGIAGFQYNIGGANQASNTFSSLGSATYLVTVTDTNSCSDTMSVTITAPGAPTIVSSADTNVSCNGANDGSILFTATGTGAISYNLQPTNITNGTGYFNNLAPNNYTVTATDASGCTVSTTANITQPTQLNIDSLTASNPTCTPGGDGSIVVNISGGIAGFQYNIGGANQASNTFSSLGSATYLVTVTDTNSCTDTMSVTLVTPSVPTVASAVDTNVSCNGAGDGSIAVTATGASAISYTLNPGAVTNATGYFNNLAPNTYTVTVSDTSNCTVDTSFVITQPAVLNIDSLTASNPTCTPGGDGSIVVNSSGGTAGFTYQLNANPAQASNTFNNLSSATYLLTVIDANNCTDTMSVTLVTPSVPTVSSAIDTNVSCNGAGDGSIAVTATGASAISYTLNPGAVTNATGYFNNLAPNTYTVTVSDTSNCTVDTSFVITQPAVLNIDSLTATNPTCTPGGDGSIVVNISGGTAGFQYNIGGANQASNTFSSLGSATYLVTVADTNSCSDTMSVTITAPGAPTIVSSADTNVSCNGANDGSILFTATGTGAISYNLQPTNITNATGYFNNLSPNNYTITATDASGCTVSTTANITQPTQLNIDSLTASNPTCTPGGDGSIVVNISGGTAGFQYNIGGANQASNTFSSLGSATYLVTVADTNSCSDTMSVTLVTPPVPTIILSLDTNVSCNGASDGSIAVSGNGPSAITYTLNPGAVSNATGYFNNLTPNTYSITLSDASSCTVSTSVTITEPAQLNIDSLTSTLPSCAPGNDGIIIVNATGGTTPYQYNVGGANQSSNTFNNLASGIYLVTVTDTNSCADTMSIDLSAPNAPIITSTLDTNVSCNGLANGSVQITGTAATAITYTLNPGAISNATGYFNNLAPNTYSITLSDASSCTVSTSITITEPAQLNIDSLTSALPSCAPGNDGIIIVNATGGTTPYQYNVGGANQSSNTFNSLASGIYLVTVTDTNSCTDTMSIDLSAPNAPTLDSVVSSNVTCFGLNNGSVQVTGTAATAITYTLNPGTVSNATGYFNNLAPNTYSITLSDASSCTVSTSVIITEPTQLNIDSLTSILPSCAPGNDGIIIVNATGGTTPYQYNVGGANQSSNTFNNLASGIYLLTVTDTNSCTDTMSVDLTSPIGPSIVSVADTNINCNNANNGSVQVSATGTGALTYTMNPGAVSNTNGYFGSLAPNTYTITVSDPNSCSVTTAVTITQPTALSIDSLTRVSPSCSPGGDGSIVVNVTGGTTPYQFNIGGANQSSNAFNNLASATYLVMVTDTNNCVDTMSVNLSAPNAPTITSILDTNVSCNGLANGSMQVSGVGASAITYTLNPGAVSNATGYFNNLAPNAYTVTLSDASSCTISTSVVITQPSALTIDSLSLVNPSCSPGGDGSIVANVTGGTMPYQYNIGGANQASNSFASLVANTYLVTVIDSNNCTDTMSAILVAPSAPLVTSVVDTSVSCFAQNNGAIQISATANSAIAYTLNPGAISNATGYFNNLAPNAYTITVSDASNCSTTTLVNISQPNQLSIDSLTATSPSCSPGGDGSLVVNISGGTPNFQYNIGGANQSSNSFTNLSATTYLVTVTDTNSCTDTMSITLAPPSAPTITSALDTNVSCNGLNDGSIQVSGSGASAITYTLNPGAVSNATGYFNNLVPNAYTIILSDASNCTVSTSVTITQPTALSLDSLTTSNPTCSPGGDGSILANVTGGTMPYQYNIGGANQTSNSFANLVANTYLVTVIDSNNCTDTMSVALLAPSVPVITSVVDTNVSCFGQNDASIQIAGTGSTVLTYTLNPGTVVNATGYFNNLTPNAYTITLSDASNCTVSTTVNITQPNQLSIDSLTATSPSCSPGGDGSLLVNVSGGTPNFQYNIGGTNQSSNLFNNLTATTYLVTVTDTNSCTDTMSITLAPPSAPTITSTLDTNVTCNGLGNGSIQITGTGSSAITYTLNPGAVSNATGYFNNLVPNAYTITLSDASNCTASTSVIITEPTVLTLDSLTTTNPTCSPGADASIVVNVTGGTTPYQYNIGGANQASNSFANLVANTYLVTVIDSNNCTDTMSVILAPPAPPVVTSVLDTNVTCNGQNNGSIQVTGSGSSALSYTLNPGALTNATGYFNNLSPNTYAITLSDASNCTVSTTVNITAPASLNIDSITSSIPSCSPGGDGSIIVFANGGTTPYLYNIGGANQSSNTFNSLASNIYLVTVTDSNSCMDTMTVDLNTPAGPAIISTLDTNVSCNGLNNGSVQVTGTATSTITYTLNPGAVSNATGYFNSLAPNAYTITLSDANNCTASTTINITEPVALTWNPDTVSNISCNGLTDGSINITASGGTTPLAYTLNPGSFTNATGAFTNLGVNTYTIVASDANACSISTTVAITEPTLLVLDSLSITNETCSPGTDGAIVVNASGGTTTYQYDIGGVGQASNSFANLVGGVYTVTVTDANNCSVSSVANISSATSPSIDSVSVTEASCTPGCDATAIINVPQGTSSAVSYSINGVAYQNANNYASLCANNYTAYIQDANGCTDTLVFVISTSATPVIDSMMLTSTLCFGDSNATATVLASGGNGSLSYSLTPTNQNNTSGIFTGLYATNYMVSVVDTNGCQVDSNFTIIDAPSIVWDSVTATDALCFGDSNGTITSTTNGGTGTITFGITPNPSSNTTGAFVSLGGNVTYTIVASDANACSISTTAFVAEPIAVGDTNVQVTNVTCNGAGDGSFSIQGTGGTPAYSYNVMPGNLNNNTGSFANLSGNTYTVTITDANSCTHTATVVVVEPEPVSIDSTSITDVSCNGLSDGELFVSASGGVGGFNYNLQPGNIINGTGVYNGLVANTYTVIATDGNGCSVSTSLTVNEPLPIVVDSLDITNVSCNGLSDGAITVFSSGGNGGNTYLLNPGNVSNGSGIFNNLAANIYTMTVTDSKGCSVSIIDTVTEPAPLAATYTTDSVSCFGGNDGQMQVTTTGGTQPYSLTLSPGATTNSTGLFTGLIAGTYAVNIVDSNGCPFTLSNIQIDEPTPVVFTSVTTVNVVCFGDSTGEINVTAAGGTGNITFALSPNIGTQNPSGNFTDLAAITYIVTATDANNCTATTLVTINQNPQIEVINLTFTEPTCHGDSNATMSFTAIGGVGTLQFSFNGSPFSSDTSHANLGAGAYSLIIQDSLGCSIDTSLIITEPEPVGVGSYELTATTCDDSKDGKIVLQATGGRPYYTYYRRPGISFNQNGIFYELKKGVYTITIVDSSGCKYDTAFNILSNPNPLQTSISKTDLPCKGYGNEGTAKVDVQGGVPPYAYLWSSTPASIESEVIGLRFGYYFVEVIDAAGCKIVDTTYINPGECCTEVFLPNAFSPNGDGLNDEFRVLSTAGMELRQFEIFNRWGQKVWETYNYTDSWNGTFKGEAQPISDYYYIFRYNCTTDGKEYIRKGNITLIR